MAGQKSRSLAADGVTLCLTRESGFAFLAACAQGLERLGLEVAGVRVVKMQAAGHCQWLTVPAVVVVAA
jgi:hypothetical protein